MRVLPPALLAGLALLGGCVGETDLPPGEYRLSGSFLGSAFPSELDELEFYTRDAGGAFSMDGGIPPSFLATGLTGGACKALHSFALTRVYLETVSACILVEGGEPSAPRLVAAPASVLVSAPVG